MKRRATMIVCTLLILSFFAAAQSDSHKSLLIRNVTVIDCVGHKPESNMSVLIQDGHIKALGRGLRAPAGATVLDGTGKYLIPGLWNMHVHLGGYPEARSALSKYLAQGVTGLRDMGSPLDDILRLKREVDEGTILGPHMFVSGPIVQGPLPFQMPVFISVKNVTEARETVDMLQNRGVNFIKIQDAIPHEIYVAIAEEAKRVHLTFAGHIPPTVTPEEASNLGQHSIEHFGGRFWGVLVGSSRQELRLQAQEVQMYQDILAALEHKAPPPSPNMRAPFTSSLIESYDNQKALALARLFRKNDTWQCPTLVALQTLWDDAEAQYTPEDMAWARRVLDRDVALVSVMQKAGVGLLAGTDLAPDAKSGTLHDELAALVDAGLTPMEALETATRNPAKFLGRLNSLGTVEQGKTADLVLLEANPLADIHNTRRVFAVILGGQLLSNKNRQQ
jgi:hypothetical protein